MASSTDSAMNSNDSVTIAVMGATGSGKSTFVNLASGSKLQVGSSLESCTSEVQVASPFLLDGKTVTLIDTPGFDDTVKTEAEILRLITDFLAVTYEQGRKLNGVIFIHRISDYRMGGVARKNFRLFRKLCGDDSLKNVVIATNMWGDVTPEVGEKREQELSSNELFFKPALEKGAQLVRHNNTAASAHAIVRRITGFPPAALQIQRETVDEHKELVETDAGQDLKAELERQAAAHVRELDELRGEMQLLLSAKDAAHRDEITELNASLRDVQGQLEKVEDEARRLRAEHESSREEHEARMRAMADEMRAREEELRALQDHARAQKEKVGQLEAALREAERKAVEEEASRVRADEDLKTSNAVYQQELEKMRAEFDRKVEAARREAAQKAAEAPRMPSRPEPSQPAERRRPTPQNVAQERWAKAYTSTQQPRSGIFGALGVMLDSIFGPRYH